jgi:peptidyl-prolyl cis-trans isomerase A (cyclophilin A)
MSRGHTVLALAAIAAQGAAHATEVAVCTDVGRAVLELADTQAPLHVANFLRYVDMGYYSGTVFHRVVPKFVVQGGGVDRQLRSRPTLAPIKNESSNGLSNLRGSVAAARSGDPDSHTSQFFVNLEDHPALDAGKKPGYTVFARVKEGIGVFDEIGRLPTGGAGPFKADVPTPLVAIRSIARLDEAALAELPAENREAVLKERIMAAAASGNHGAALELVERYRALCGAADPEIALVEAAAALANDDRARGVFVLQEYFATTAPTDATYARATELYRQAVPDSPQGAARLIDGCEPPEAPIPPDGATATIEDMLAGQDRAKEFVAAAELYLACLAKVIDDPDRAVADRSAATAEHNRTVGAMERTAAAFNEQIRRFKERE